MISDNFAFVIIEMIQNFGTAACECVCLFVYVSMSLCVSEYVCRLCLCVSVFVCEYVYLCVSGCARAREGEMEIDSEFVFDHYRS